jgi:hypothetical protein
MQLHAYEPRLLFGNQIPQVLSERSIIPFLEQKRIGQHEQNATAFVHYVFDVIAEDFLLVIFLVVMQNVVLDQKVLLDELNQAVSNPFFGRLVVADEQIVLFVALGAAFARTYLEKVGKKPEYAR